MDNYYEYINLLRLEDHIEKGFCLRTWVSEHTVSGAQFSEPRPAASVIYYAVVPNQNVEWHRMNLTAEIWFYQAGSPVEMILGGSGEKPSEESSMILGPDIKSGHALQCVVPAGVWQMTRPLGADTAIVSCVVVPAFSFEDYEILLSDGTHIKAPELEP